MSKILTLAGTSEGLGRPATRRGRGPTADLKVGQCICILNTRTKKGVSVCRVPPGQTRSGIKFKGSCPNPIKTK